MTNLIIEILPIIAFIIGFSFGFSVKRNDKLPEINPVKIVKEKKEEIIQEKKKSQMEQYLENIDNYPYNQKDIKE